MERNLRFKIDWASPKVGRKFTVFALFYFVFEGNFQVQAPWGGAYTWRGHLTEGFYVTSLGGLYLEGLILGILRPVYRKPPPPCPRPKFPNISDFS